MKPYSQHRPHVSKARLRGGVFNNADPSISTLNPKIQLSKVTDSRKISNYKPIPDMSRRLRESRGTHQKYVWTWLPTEKKASSSKLKTIKYPIIEVKKL